MRILNIYKVIVTAGQNNPLAVWWPFHGRLVAVFLAVGGRFLAVGLVVAFSFPYQQISILYSQKKFFPQKKLGQYSNVIFFLINVRPLLPPPPTRLNGTASLIRK